MEDNVDISALTMEQYIALIPDDIKPGIVIPEIGDDVEFEINANFMRDLKRKLFASTDDVDAYEHGRTVLEIVDLFHFPGVTHDAIMFGKVHIFYTGLDISTRKILDSNGFIPLMRPTQSLESIQVMADHSHYWYDETTTRERINNNVDAIHESFKGEHLTKEYPLKKEDEAIKHSRYMESLEETIIKFCEDTIKKQTADDERMRKILENTESNIRALKTTTNNLQEKAYQLTHKVLTNTTEKVKAITTMGKENMKEPVPHDLSPTPFLGHLKEQMDERDMDVGWDITSKDVERLKQLLTPTIHTLPNLEPVVQLYILLGPVHDKDKIVKEKEQDYDIPLNDSVMQPLTPQTVYITPLDDDYVVPATNPMSNQQLNKFEEEFSHITKVAEKEYDNPVIKTYDCETFIWKLLHQVSQSSREMKFQQQYGSNLSFPYPIANHSVHCYSHSHLISRSRSLEAFIENGSTYNHVGIKSLRKDGDNLKDFCQVSNLKAMLREFLVLIYSFLFISFP
ncbi:hypothetical protein Tco_0185537 [Tanacetum coccineum]